jgi:hypothetical protein
LWVDNFQTCPDALALIPTPNPARHESAASL